MVGLHSKKITGALLQEELVELADGVLWVRNRVAENVWVLVDLIVVAALVSRSSAP